MNSVEMSNPPNQTESVRSMDSISELAIIDKDRKTISSITEHFEYEDDRFSQVNSPPLINNQILILIIFYYRTFLWKNPTTMTWYI